MTQFNQNAVYLLNRMTAEKIDAKMRTVRSGRKKYERSWIWELIQNAKDKATIDFPNEKVSIKIELTNTQLEFGHNYGFFTQYNVEGLIRQINSEDKDREDVILKEENSNPPIGRFGTGFMTTHLLSENVAVSGLYKDGSNFKNIRFSLDRSGVDRNCLIQSVDTSFKEAESSLSISPILNVPDFADFNTKFIYHLDEDKRPTAEIGLADLQSSLPYTLIFVEGIKDVIIKTSGQYTLYEKREPKLISDEIKLIEIVKTVNGESTILRFVYLSKNLTSIALPIEIIEEKIHILPLPANLPQIFLHFPLVGTEDFHFPVVVNNPFFEPTEPRDGIYLLEDSHDSKSVTDQIYIKEATELFSILLPFAIENNWGSLYHLAKTAIPKISEEFFSKSWFKENIQKTLRSQLLKSQIVQTEKDTILLETALFPFAPESKINRLWDILYPIHGKSLPRKVDVNHWHKIIDSHWGKDLRVDIKKLLQEVSTIGSIDQLVIQKGFSEKEAINWLNQVIEFTIELDEEKLLNELAVIPNQYGIFKKREELWFDQSIPAELKSVLKKLDTDWEASLQKREIIAYTPQIRKSQEDIVSMINTFIKNNSNRSNLKEAVLELTSLIPSNGIENKPIRTSLWNFASDFYSETPEKQIVEGFDKSVWEESDKWLLKTLFSQIASCQTVSSLSATLNKPAVSWLHDFVIFLGKSGFGSYLNDHKLLPDQLGVLKKKTELYLDNEIDTGLKEICEGLTNSLKSTLLDTGIFLEIENRSISTLKVAKMITEKVTEIYNSDHGNNRGQETKNLFEKLLKWMFDKGEATSKELFKGLYERRNLVLRTDEENIQAIEFRQSILNNSNGYTEEDILKFIKTPKEDFIAYTSDDFKKRVEEEVNKRLGIGSGLNELDPKEVVLNLGITSNEDLLKAMEKFEGTPIGEALQYIPTNTDFSYVYSIIQRAKENVKCYLSTRPEYNISNWKEESFTVIDGIEKNGFPIKLVIRPSDGRQVVIWYQEEFEALDQKNSFAELWHDNNVEQSIYSFGKFLRKTKINRLPV